MYRFLVESGGYSMHHADNNTGGFGPSLTYSSYGAVNAILENQRTGQKSFKEALIATQVNGKIESLYLKIISPR